MPDDLPRQVVSLDLPEAEKRCPCCGEMRHEIGEEVSEKLDVEPAKLTVLQYRRKKYACRACGAEVQTAPMPAQVIEQGLATPGLLAHVAVAKFADHMPLARLEKGFARQHIELPRSTMTDWMLTIGTSCEPLTQRMGEVLKTLDYLGSDDTTLPYQNGRPGKTTTARLWVWRGELGDKVLLLYQFTEDRSGTHPAEFLRGWSGYLQADAYSGYDSIFTDGKIIEVGCMAHARRRYFEIAKTAKTQGFAHEVVELIRHLYALERQAKEQGFSPPQVQAWRQERALPLLEDLKIRLEAHWPKLPPKGPLAEAIGYTLRNWKALTRYLDDGRLNIDNNRTENAIRPVGGEFVVKLRPASETVLDNAAPGVLIQRGWRWGWRTGALRRRGAVERAVNAMCVVVVSEFIQLPGQVDHVPEEHAIEILAPNRADQPFDERMRDRSVRNRLDLLDLEDAQVGEPAVEAKQRVVIGAEVFR